MAGLRTNLSLESSQNSKEGVLQSRQQQILVEWMNQWIYSVLQNQQANYYTNLASKLYLAVQLLRKEFTMIKSQTWLISCLTSQSHLPLPVCLFHASCPQYLLDDKLAHFLPRSNIKGSGCLYLSVTINMNGVCGNKRKKKGTGSSLWKSKNRLLWGLNHVLFNRNKTCHLWVN